MRDRYAGRSLVRIEPEPVRWQMGVGRTHHAVDHIPFDAGAWLRTEGVNARAVVIPPSEMMDAIQGDEIIAHDVRARCPSPSHGDGGIGNVFHFIMLDGSLTGIADADAHASPIFVGHIGHEVVADGHAGGHFAIIFRLPRAVYLISVFLVVSGQEAVAGDVFQQVSFDGRIPHAPAHIDACGGEVPELTTGDLDIGGVFDIQCPRGATYPGLVVESGFLVRTGGAQSISFGHVQSVLMRNMAEAGRSCPGSVFERDPNDADML